MKKTTGIWFAAILCMIISVTVSADVQNKQTEPDYKTDYYMIVESKAGGIDSCEAERGNDSKWHSFAY